MRTISSADADVIHGYDATSSNLDLIVAAAGSTLRLAYGGSLATDVMMSVTIAGSVHREYKPADDYVSASTPIARRQSRRSGNRTRIRIPDAT
ncbi:MAG TPA: hypothetical protein VIA18_00230 [Polyangia bacterium]|nr:hypothetical protein [Polyangia bacterium]